MILKYNNFIFENDIQSEVDIWIRLFESTNESNSSLSERIEIFIKKLVDQVPTDNQLTDKLSSIFKKIKSRTSLLVLVTSILVTLSIKDIIIQKSLNDAGINKEQSSDIIRSSKSKKHVDNHLKKYLNAIAQRESSGASGTWDTVSSTGYIGKYQFGNIALKECGYSFNVNDFKKDPNIFPESEQDKAMITLLKKNTKYLGKYISKFKGKIIGGVKITTSGLLAAAHLVGAGNIKKFLNSYGEYVPKDGNGTPCTEYIEKFGGYKINI